VIVGQHPGRVRPIRTADINGNGRVHRVERQHELDDGIADNEADR
jgi:hypothetical protein